jgi:hypothetical protein
MATQTSPGAKHRPTPNEVTPPVDVDLDALLRAAIPAHGDIDWNEVAAAVLAQIPDEGWREAALPMAREWLRHRNIQSRRRPAGYGDPRRFSLWAQQAPQASPAPTLRAVPPCGDVEARAQGTPWYTQPAVRDAIEHDLDELFRGESATKRLRDFTIKDVASAKARAETNARSALLRVKAFDALLGAMNKHRPEVVGELPRDVLKALVPSLFMGIEREA